MLEGTKSVVAATFLCLLVVSCSAHRQAGTGDIAFRLLWDGESDLDLMVLDPGGQCLSFLTRTSDSGGLLDVDCNGGTGKMCDWPIENVYWPRSKAPVGQYTFWVKAHSLIPAESPLEFEMQILRGSRVVWTQQEKMVEHQQIYGPADSLYPIESAPRFETGRDLPTCADPHPAFDGRRLPLPETLSNG